MDSSMDMSTKTCRTCANISVRCYVINSKICNFATTIKEMIVLLVPQMETELDENDVICNICRKTLIHCVKFIDKCLHVEADRKDNVLCQGKSLDTAPIKNLKVSDTQKELTSTVKDPQCKIARKQKKTAPNLIDKEVIIEVEDDTDCSKNLLTKTNNCVEKEVKSENDMEMVYEHIKPEPAEDVIKNEVDNLIDVDEIDTNGSSLNGYFNDDDETDQVLDLSSENNNDISDNTLKNDPVKELPSKIDNYNRFISAQQISTDNLNEFIGILASNDVSTIQFSQDSGRRTENKRVILIGSTFKCKKCYKYFSARGKYARHLEAHRKVEQRREDREKLRKLRKQKLEERKAQRKQQKKQHKKTYVDLKCKTCSEKLSSIEDLELHLKIHPPFVCEKCGKGFAKRNQINAHRYVHNDQNSYICEVCGKALKTKSQLRQHSFIHDNTVHSCKKCPKVFNTALGLKAHMRNTHCEGRTRIWICKICGRIFKRSCLYEIHYRQIHLRDGHRKCDICGQGFYRSDYLTRHKKRHVRYGECLNNDAAKGQTNASVSNGTVKEVERRNRKRRLPPGPFQCQICMKVYKNLNNLKRHIFSHGKARLSCKYCSRTFKMKYLLNRHEKVRHNKPDLSVKYSFDIVVMSTLQPKDVPGAMLRNISIEDHSVFELRRWLECRGYKKTGSKEQLITRCDICWKRFEIQEDLDQHYFTHRSFKHKCELCGESFAREHLLNDHMVNVHVEDGDDNAEEELRTLMMTGLGTTLYNLINV